MHFPFAVLTHAFHVPYGYCVRGYAARFGHAIRVTVYAHVYALSFARCARVHTFGSTYTGYWFTVRTHLPGCTPRAACRCHTLVYCVYAHCRRTHTVAAAVPHARFTHTAACLHRYACLHLLPRFCAVACHRLLRCTFCGLRRSYLVHVWLLPAFFTYALFPVTVLVTHRVTRTRLPRWFVYGSGLRWITHTVLRLQFCTFAFAVPVIYGCYRVRGYTVVTIAVPVTAAVACAITAFGFCGYWLLRLLVTRLRLPYGYCVTTLPGFCVPLFYVRCVTFAVAVLFWLHTRLRRLHGCYCTHVCLRFPFGSFSRSVGLVTTAVLRFTTVPVTHTFAVAFTLPHGYTRFTFGLTLHTFTPLFHVLRWFAHTFAHVLFTHARSLPRLHCYAHTRSAHCTCIHALCTYRLHGLVRSFCRFGCYVWLPHGTHLRTPFTRLVPIQFLPYGSLPYQFSYFPCRTHCGFITRLLPLATRLFTVATRRFRTVAAFCHCYALPVRLVTPLRLPRIHVWFAWFVRLPHTIHHGFRSRLVTRCVAYARYTAYICVCVVPTTGYICTPACLTVTIAVAVGYTLHAGLHLHGYRTPRSGYHVTHLPHHLPLRVVTFTDSYCPFPLLRLLLVAVAVDLRFRLGYALRFTVIPFGYTGCAGSTTCRLPFAHTRCTTWFTFTRWLQISRFPHGYCTDPHHWITFAVRCRSTRCGYYHHVYTAFTHTLLLHTSVRLRFTFTVRVYTFAHFTTFVGLPHTLRVAVAGYDFPTRVHAVTCCRYLYFGYLDTFIFIPPLLQVRLRLLVCAHCLLFAFHDTFSPSTITVCCRIRVACRHRTTFYHHGSHPGVARHTHTLRCHTTQCRFRSYICHRVQFDSFYVYGCGLHYPALRTALPLRFVPRYLYAGSPRSFTVGWFPADYYHLYVTVRTLLDFTTQFYHTTGSTRLFAIATVRLPDTRILPFTHGFCGLHTPTLRLRLPFTFGYVYRLLVLRRFTVGYRTPPYLLRFHILHVPVLACHRFTPVCCRSGCRYATVYTRFRLFCTPLRACRLPVTLPHTHILFTH